MEIRLVLEKKQDQAFIPFSNQTYRFNEPVMSSTPDDLARGWSNGLKKIISQFIDDYHPSD